MGQKASNKRLDKGDVMLIRISVVFVVTSTLVATFLFGAKAHHETASPAVVETAVLTNHSAVNAETQTQIEADHLAFLNSEKQNLPEADAQAIPSINKRFASEKATETPHFQQHLMPLMGRLGCNGRSCHGSFQGRGGFQLSLFGYDFPHDHKSITAGKEPRVDLKKPLDSLIIQKPTDADNHEGGQRIKVGSWEYHVFKRWVENGAKYNSKTAPKLVKLDVTPREILFLKDKQKASLQAIAHWSDGRVEDVTPLCRFKSNNTEIATIDNDGKVTAVKPGDTHLIVFYDNGVAQIPVIRPVSRFTGTRYPNVPTPTKIDQFAVQKLRKLGIVPSELSVDTEFLRRVSLDVTGTLPSPQEIKKFLADKSPNKRKQKIDELLNSKAYAAWWTTKLCDFTGNNANALRNAIPVRGRATNDWYNWLYKRVANNTPYDKIVEGIVTATSREKGESFEEYCKNMSAMYQSNPTKQFADRDSLPLYWARQNFRKPDERAIGFAYTFLGMRIQCAQCHKHPFDRWTKNDFKQFTGFFGKTQFGVSDRQQAQTMLQKLGIDKSKKGGELRKEVSQLLRDGKVVPFQEVFTRKGSYRKGKGTDSKKQQKILRQRLQQLNVQIVAAEKRNQIARIVGLTKQQKSVSARLKAVDQKVRREKQQGGGGAKLLGGDVVDLSQHADPRVPLMNWLRNDKNRLLARAFVNRVWASYFNVGIVNPPDNLSMGNPPSNKPLLDYLTNGFIKNRYNIKWLHREILNSRTYQLSWKSNETNRFDERNFSHAIPRRLPAEIAYDVLQQATRNDAAHAAARSQLAGRAIAIPAADYRNRGSQAASYALKIFGQSTRESNCDCDRSMESSLLQTVFLQNDYSVQAMISRSDNGWLVDVAKKLNVPFTPIKTNNQYSKAGRERQLKKRKELQQLFQKQKNNRKAIQLLQKQIQKAVQKGKGKQPQVLQLRRRLAVLRKQQAALINSAKKPQMNNKKLPNFNATSIIQDAYLRTLSRYPTQDELATAKQYIDTSDSTMNGIRDLLWVLLNTKEFIVNH